MIVEFGENARDIKPEGPEAMEAAGFSTKSNNADRLRRNEAISARIAWIKANAAENCGITVAGLLNELKKLAYSNAADYVDLTGPEPKVDLKRASRDKMAAVSEISVYSRAGRVCVVHPRLVCASASPWSAALRYHAMACV